MTDYSEGRTLKCGICGTPFWSMEGPECDCSKKKKYCADCGDLFGLEEDNQEKELCYFCEKYFKEEKDI